MDEPSRVGACQVTKPLYVCVHVPEFAAQALLRLRPDLAHSAVAILAGDPPFEQVCSANAQACRLGVLQGMTRVELDTFTGLRVLRRSETEERGARHVLLEAAGAFTPRIEVHASSASSFVMVLDMTGTRLVFGPIQKSVHNILHSLLALGFFAHFAASTNFHAAICIAQSAHKGPIILAAGSETAHLHDLPVHALHLTVSQADTLALWGVHTLGELAELPEVELIVRLGQEGRRLRLLARGEHPHLMVPEEPVFVLEEFVVLDTPIELMESLLFVIGPMLDQLLSRAQNRSFALANIKIKLGLDGGGAYERFIEPALPVLQRDVLLKLLHLDLQAHPPPAGVMSIFVHAEPGDRSKVQLGLFAPQLPEPLRLDVTLARIAALVGEERVGRARLLDTHRPESFTLERFTIPTATAKEHTNKERILTRLAVALRRCRPPLDLSVQHEGKRPASFSLHGRRYTVQEAYGPWRKSGNWWSSEVWSSEEWDVCAVAKADDTLLCVITHDLLRKNWQLEALYD